MTVDRWWPDLKFGPINLWSMPRLRVGSVGMTNPPPKIYARVNRLDKIVEILSGR